jgi:hypothetical protein
VGMFTIEILETGDTAEADCPESAALAALTLSREAKCHVATQGFDPTIVIRLDGRVVFHTTYRSLNR